MTSSLFSSSGDSGSFAAATRWVEELLRGQLVTTIAILAVVLLGYQMMSGRLSLRAAMRVTLGCFVLFGSSAIAQGLIGISRDGGAARPTMRSDPAPPLPLPRVSPETNANPFDPYSRNLPPD